VLEFIEPENRPPNRPDVNPVWGALQQMVYRDKIWDSDWLKRMLIDCWTRISQNMLKQAIYQLPRRLIMFIKVEGANVEVCLDLFCVQISIAVTFTVCSSCKLDKITEFLSNSA